MTSFAEKCLAKAALTLASLSFTPFKADAQQGGGVALRPNTAPTATMTPIGWGAPPSLYGPQLRPATGGLPNQINNTLTPLPASPTAPTTTNGVTLNYAAPSPSDREVLPDPRVLPTYGYPPYQGNYRPPEYGRLQMPSLPLQLNYQTPPHNFTTIAYPVTAQRDQISTKEDLTRWNNERINNAARFFAETIDLDSLKLLLNGLRDSNRAEVYRDTLTLLLERYPNYPFIRNVVFEYIARDISGELGDNLYSVFVAGSPRPLSSALAERLEGAGRSQAAELVRRRLDRREGTWTPVNP